MKFDIDTSTQEAKDNHNAMLSALNEFKSIEHTIVDLSDKKKTGNKLSPFERLKALLDKDSTFIPLSSIAGYGMHGDKDGSGAGGGLITGIGQVNGLTCAIMINNYTVKGGTFSPSGMKKILRLQEIALNNKLPVVHLLESGGANLNHAAEIFVAGGEAFANQARLSAAGIPQLVVVHGNATAGGAYQPGMADLVVLIEGQSKMFLGGPPLVKAATGETATEEALGGTKLHAKTTGTGEFLVKDDREAIAKARDLVDRFKNVFEFKIENKKFSDPEFNAEELLSLIPSNPKKTYDVRKLWARVIDAQTMEEFKKEADIHTICCFGDIGGLRVGMIGNNGPITSPGANKAAQFIQLCDQLNLPLIFFHNTTGFMVGTHSEKSGMIKHGSKMIQAVTNARVGKISLIVGGSYGAGNYAMCGRGMNPDFIFSWPNSKTAVMGGEQAGKVMRIVSEAQLSSKGKEIDDNAMAEMENDIAQKINAQASSLFGSARLWDDGIIDPRTTRNLLFELLTVMNKREKIILKPNTFGVSRF